MCLPSMRALLLATCVLLLWPGLASTEQESDPSVPLHAHMKDYGTGWEYNDGYRRSDGQKCMKIEVPENSFLSFDSDERVDVDLGHACFRTPDFDGGSGKAQVCVGPTRCSEALTRIGHRQVLRPPHAA